MRLWPVTLLLASALGACAATTGPTSLPTEVLVVLDQQERALRLVAVDSTATTITIPLGTTVGAPTTLAVRGTKAAVGMNAGGLILIVDLVSHQVIAQIVTSLGDNTPIASIAFSEEGDGYAASPVANLVTRFTTAGAAEQISGLTQGPQAFGMARGRVFFVNGNRAGCYPVQVACANNASWLAPFERGKTPLDSIPLLGPGNAVAAVPSSDGVLYVLIAGNGGTVEGRLSAVDPVRQREVASYGGLGVSPLFMVSDGADRLLIASAAEGLMVFNTRTRALERGAGSGIPLQQPRGLASDGLGRSYVVEAGSCTAGGSSGRIRVFGADLVERRTIATGVCPVAAAITEIRADLFPLLN
jgi:hypothetical protein